MKNLVPILCITGSDCAGRVGIQSDIRTVTDLGGYALTAVTCLTTVDDNGGFGIYGLYSAGISGTGRTTITSVSPRGAQRGFICKGGGVKSGREENGGC